MPYGKVSNIIRSDDAIILYIEVDGFEEGAAVEISGYATQDNGAVATFSSVQVMPVKSAKETTLIVEAAVPPGTFPKDFPITVVARASEIWLTKLGAVKNAEDLAKMGEKLRPSSAAPTVAWTRYEPSSNLLVPPQSQAAQSEAAQSRSPEAGTGSTLLRHGTWWDRNKGDRPDQVMEGRFTRLFPYLPAASFDHGDLVRLAEHMIAAAETGPETTPDPEENPGIPAAYTYLGQFIDHDLTFDPSSHLREKLSRAQLRRLVDFRTPRLDLDNLYGRGPDDQPYMYEDGGLYLLLGEHLPGNPLDPYAIDLPRGPNGRALIGDPRDDENRIVAQLHTIFLRFHNAVADRMGGKGNVSLQEVRQQVQWHYQWTVVGDFLPRILPRQTYESVFPSPYRPVTTIRRLKENDLELMPVEFSVAAYRFGHSMVRPRYRLNPDPDVEHPIFSDDPDDFTADLGGFRRIPPGWAIDWQFFVDLGQQAGPNPQLSYKIDTSLAHPLGNLPARVARDPSSLALRNLERSVTFQLPSGQQVARELKLPVIPDEELTIGPATVAGPRQPITEVVPRLAGNAPLWAYILSEAQVTSWQSAPGPAADKTPVKLGPVGGRLVAEVFASLLLGDRRSYLYAEPAFSPRPEFTPGGTFGLAELINVALRRLP